MNNIIYDIPDEPKSADSTISSITAQIVDLNNDMNDLTEMVHKQWSQFCIDNEDMEANFIAKYKKLFILLVVNMGVSGVLLYAVISMLLI